MSDQPMTSMPGGWVRYVRRQPGLDLVLSEDRVPERPVRAPVNLADEERTGSIMDIEPTRVPAPGHPPVPEAVRCHEPVDGSLAERDKERVRGLDDRTLIVDLEDVVVPLGHRDLIPDEFVTGLRCRVGGRREREGRL